MINIRPELVADEAFVRSLVPGGIQPGDHCHVTTSDGTCSRCRCAIPDDQVPIVLWGANSAEMWMFCPRCTGDDELEPDDEDDE